MSASLKEQNDKGEVDKSTSIDDDDSRMWASLFLLGVPLTIIADTSWAAAEVKEFAVSVLWGLLCALGLGMAIAGLSKNRLYRVTSYFMLFEMGHRLMSWSINKPCNPDLTTFYIACLICTLPSRKT